MKKRIITIVGARPQIIKASAISRAIEKHFNSELEEIIVHTGQHYDENMSQVFFQEMGIPQPKYNLHVGSGSHASQTALMLEGLEKIFLEENPDAILVYGDTNSTIAGALAAVKIKIPVVHVEAGLRSFNKSMPEEINRIACDHMSTLLFTPTLTGLENLKNEGFKLHDQHRATLNHPKVFHCGDIMLDNSLYFSEISATKSGILASLDLQSNQYLLVTIHRDSNTDDPKKMENIFSALLEIQKNSGLSIVLPIHPRTHKNLQTQLSPALYKELVNNSHFYIIPPAGFLDIISLEKNARMIITDSGGLQKEAYFFERPCLILRPQTEWVEIVENGNAQLVDADKSRILNGFNELYTKKDFTFPALYGDGKAAEFICRKLVDFI